MTPVLRGLFAGLAVLAIATQVARIRADAHAQPPPSVSDGLASLGLTPASTGVPDILTAAAPGCASPVVVSAIHFNGLGEADAQAVRAARGKPVFVYLGAVAGHMDMGSIATRWVAAGVLRAVGLRSERVPHEVEMAVLPAECPGLRYLDWSRIAPWR